MFLRLLLAVLVVANIGYFVWSRHEAARAEAQREPHRTGQQIHPDWLQLQPAPAPR